MPRQAIAVAEAVDAPLIQASGHFINGLVYAVTGRLERGVGGAPQALTLSRSAATSQSRPRLWCCTAHQRLAGRVCRGITPPLRGDAPRAGA